MPAPTLSLPAAATFAGLVAAMIALWAPRVSQAPQAREWWVFPFAAALVLAQIADLLDTSGLVAMFALVTACRVGQQAPEGWLKGFALTVMLALSAAILAHALPGFANPRVLDGVRLSADALPYTKYLNIDKGLMGLFLLGLFAPQRTPRRSVAPPHDLLARFAIVAVLVMTATVAAGYAHWDPKVPSWWPVWLWSMVFLTALPEEALFRHVIQGGLQDSLGNTVRARWIGMGVSGVLFGLSHAGGGATYVALATLAGLGYGWLYAVSGSIAVSILAHTGLNLLHLLLFTYPALAP